MSRFTLDVRKWANEAEESLEETVIKIEIELFSRVILRSPVDTGRFRSNWNVDQRTQHFDVEGAEMTVSRMAGAVEQAGAGRVTSFINALPYAERLEFGHSKQAPQGMVRVTALEFGAIVEDVAAAN